MTTPMWTDVLGAWSSFASAAIGAAALATIIVVGVQIRLQRTQLHRDLENLYVTRYWSIMDRLADAEMAPAGEREARRTLAIRAYLQLSEDECDLRAADRVTDATWREWIDGIQTQLRDRDFRALLDASPAGQFRNLRRLIETPESFEPSITAPRVRQKKGL